MSRRLMFVLLVNGMLIASGIPGPAHRVSGQQPIGVEAPKWDLGDRWTWQRGNDQITWTVVGTSGGYAVQSKSGSDTSTTHLGLDFSSREVHFVQLQFPLTVGKEWIYSIEGVTPGGRAVKWDIKRKVEAMESIAVPAGTFDAVRVSGHHCVGAYCGDFVAWYAPKAKQVAKITWSNADYWFGSQRGLSQVLVSYELHTP